MKIIKRNGASQSFAPNKILTRIKDQAKGLKGVDCDLLFQKVIPMIQDGMTTSDIDQTLAFTSADLVIKHPNYSVLGGRILITRQGKLLGVELNEYDKSYNFFSAITFLDKYSLKDDNKKPIEIPSMMIDRVCKHLAKDENEYNLFYNELKNKLINNATPILTNAGTVRGSMISCNLTMNMGDDTDSILKTINNASWASREGSGIGLLIDNLRSQDSIVSSFKGNASGVVRYADMLQSHMRFFKQGTRSGSAALYLSLWHKDIFRFLELTLPIGDEKLRARDLFTAVVVNDLFMKCLLEDKPWFLFCPNDIEKSGLKPLHELHGEEFETEYQKAVELGIGVQVEPKSIWDAMIKSQVESGKPYVMYKDNANKRNMQDNLGTISQSNLCIEIFEYSCEGYNAQCTLSAINLSEHDNLESIGKSARVLTRMLNRVIDKNVWSDEASKLGGLDQRALAIGVSGLADFFAKKKISFESEEAIQWNKDIFETIYKNAVIESMNMANEEGRTYPAYEGSRYSRGETYIEGWSPLPEGQPIPLLNSLFLGLMPTASSAILMDSFESFQPVDSNLFTRRVGQGEFLVVNKHLVNELEEVNLWNDEMIDKLITNDGSIQEIMEIPHDIRYRYKTVWEIPQKTLINLAGVRNKYVDQSQSMNLYFKEPKYGKISGALKHGWELGLKTGVYYTRTKSKLESSNKLAGVKLDDKIIEKPKDSPFECFGCSS